MKTRNNSMELKSPSDARAFSVNNPPPSADVGEYEVIFGNYPNIHITEGEMYLDGDPSSISGSQIETYFTSHLNSLFKIFVTSPIQYYGYIGGGQSGYLTLLKKGFYQIKIVGETIMGQANQRYVATVVGISIG